MIQQFWQQQHTHIVPQIYDIIHKLKATIQQAHRLSTELLRGERINKIFDFFKTSARDKDLNH
jgi:hypothetical protein